MKRDFLSIVATCILTFTLSVSALASGYPAPPDQGYTVSYAKVEWVHQYGGAVQLLQGEPVVMAGTVTGSRADGSKGIVHTYYDVEVQSVLKNESGQKIEQTPVVLTGGIDGEMQTYIRESPVLERGKTYLFVGEPSEEEGAFYPGDGYCGVFSLEEGEDGALTVGQLNPFNESMEQPLQGLTLKEIAQVVSGKIKSGVRIRIVDEQGQPVYGLNLSAREEETRQEVLNGYTDRDGMFYSLEERDGSALLLTVSQEEYGKEQARCYRISPKAGRQNRYKMIWK